MTYSHNNNSNKTTSNKDIYSKEQRNFINCVLKERKKAEKISQKNRLKPLIEINKERVLNWFFKLSLEDRKKISTISNEWLASTLLYLYSLYTFKKETEFEAAEEMLKFLNDSEKVNFFDKFSGEKLDGYESADIINDINFFEKFFIPSRSIKQKEEKEKNINEIEKEFLEKYCKFICLDIKYITLSEELLLDSKKFKKIFKFFSNDKFFTELLLSKGEFYSITLPTWMSKTKNNLALSQIIVGFFEQTILLNYEYFYYTNRIYQSTTQKNISETYDEIDNIVKQVSNESTYFDILFTQNKFEEAIKNKNMNNINDELTKTIFNELKSYIEENKSMEGNLNKLLKKLTFINIKEIRYNRMVIYESYKSFILDFLRSKIIDELTIQDDIPTKSKTTINKKNKKKKGKKIKDIEENENIRKEEENKANEEEMELQSINENKQNNEINDDDEKEIEIENEIKKDEDINEENNEIKEFRLYPTIIQKKKHKKKKQNKKKCKQSNFDMINKIKFDDNLVRINSMNSVSTYKSSNYQKELPFHENDLSIDETTQNKFPTIFINDNNDNNNIINIINEDTDNGDKKKTIEINDSTNFLDIANNINTKKNDEKKEKKKKNNTSSIQNNINTNYNYNGNCNNINNFNLNLDKQFNHSLNVGIEDYCSTIVDKNLEILNPIKKKYLKIIYDIISTGLNGKYLLQFGEYGSFATGLSIEGSDIDVCIIYTKLLNDNLMFREELFELLKKNEKSQKEFTYEAVKIFGASIPRIIVKIKISEDIEKYINNLGNLLDSDDFNFIKIDFTLSDNEEYLNDNIKNVEYIKKELNDNTQLKPVIQILKRFLRRQKKNEVYKGGISSFALFIMVLSCIKQIKFENRFKKIDTSFLLNEVFQRYAFYNFNVYKIKENNLYSYLEYINDYDRPYILNPLNDKNLCYNWSCKGSDINAIFNLGLSKLQKKNLLELFSVEE